MERASTGSIKQKLPQNAVIAHKTGSSGKNEHGITAATNDVGIMIAPNGHLY
ncbi:MAG: serine hydrolase [Bacteroidales bacterium]